jgi:H+/Cl- antiporter ClcA
MGYNVGNALKQEENEKKLMVMAGMSSVFSALFGTPFTAAIFSVEVTRQGRWKFNGLLPCVIASLVAFFVAQLCGVAPVRFLMPHFTYNYHLIWQVLLLAVLCAAVCILFALALHKTEHFGKKLLKNPHLRAPIGGLLIVGLTLLIGTTDYNGAGMGVITTAISGTANYEAFTNMAWPTTDFRALEAAMKWAKGIPQVPGGYYTWRNVNNAFYSVINNTDTASPREELMDNVIYINAEINYKREELELDK